MRDVGKFMLAVRLSGITNRFAHAAVRLYTRAGLCSQACLLRREAENKTSKGRVTWTPNLNPETLQLQTPTKQRYADYTLVAIVSIVLARLLLLLLSFCNTVAIFFCLLSLNLRPSPIRGDGEAGRG